jgi:putative cell wall-binding protein
MRRASLAALGVALTVGAGIVPATAAPVGSAPVPGRSPAPGWTAAAADGSALTKAVRESAGSATGAAGEYVLFRLAGRDRYTTAVVATQALYTDEVIATNPIGVVFVASGANFPDALSATALVAPAGPLLLVPPTGVVPAAVLDELRRLSPDVVVVVGGTGSVSTSVEAQLKTVAPTDRVAGRDRYDTAAMVALDADAVYRAQDLGPDVPPLGVQTLYVVGGANFPDALAAGAATGTWRGAIVLTKRDSLPAASADVVTTVAPQRIIVVGGTGSVSSAVVTRLKALAPGAEVLRRSGADRYAAAAAVSAGEFVHPGNGVMLANGTGFADALSAAAFGSVVEYPVLLARSTCAPAPTVAEAASYAALSVAPVEVVGVGGPASLSDAALALKRC